MSFKAYKPKQPDKPKRKSLAAMRHVREIQAQRLAAADFFYALNPSLSAHLLNISPEDALKARKHPGYERRLAELTEDMNATMRRSLKEDTEKLRLALQSMVPKALEVMNSALYGDDSNVGLRAAQEVLDRDGRMPKVSRLQTTPVDEGAMPDVEPKLLAEFMPHSKPN
jgi:hypothetical protein